jgi:tight adherence protein C
MVMSPMVFAIALVVAILLGASAVGTAAYTVVAERSRRQFVRRAAGSSTWSNALRSREDTAGAQSFRRALDFLAQYLGADAATSQRLVHAGFDAETAYTRYVLAQLICAFALGAVALLVSGELTTGSLTMALVGAAIGVRSPTWLLEHRLTSRQEALRRAIPDALDLMVVCIEAGAALDAALQRVARELAPVHPLLASELRGITRRIAAGQPRQLALQAPYERTGVEELKGLASHIAQSEKWGTSIAMVLRVYGDQMRQRQRAYAERRAATASTRMLLPLALCIFPTIFVALLGPALMRIGEMFTAMR